MGRLNFKATNDWYESFCRYDPKTDTTTLLRKANIPSFTPKFTQSPQDIARRLITENKQDHCVICTRYVHQSLNGLTLPCCFGSTHLACLPPKHENGYSCRVCFSWVIPRGYFQHELCEDGSTEASDMRRIELRHSLVEKSQ